MLALWWVPVDERKGREVIEISERTVNTILVHAQTLIYSLMSLMPTTYQRDNLQAMLGLFLQAEGKPLPEYSHVKSPSALSRFLNENRWSTRQVIRAVRQQMLNRLLSYSAKGRRPWLQVIVDLTTLEKCGKFAAFKHLIHVLNGKRGQQVRLDGLSFPVTISWLYLKRDGKFKKHFVLSTRPLKGSTITWWGKRRWAIEGFFKTGKHRFGLHRFGQGTLLGVYRWLVLSLIAFILAHWAYLSTNPSQLPDWGACAPESIAKSLASNRSVPSFARS